MYELNATSHKLSVHIWLALNQTM